MIFGNLCENCYKKMSGMFAGAAMTPYVCGICKESQLSGSTHIPGHCCNTCATRLNVCEECGSSEVISLNRQKVLDWAEKPE